MRITPKKDVQLPTRPSKYDELIDKASRMRTNTWLEIDVPSGTTQSAFRACVRQALNRYIPDDVRSRKCFVVRNLPNGTVGIHCQKVRA